MTAPVSDAELLERLERPDERAGVAVLERRPYRYATSAPLDEVRIAFADGEEATMILKDLARERLLGDAAGKPEFLHQPLRELETYRRIIGPAGIGPVCLAAVAAGDPPRHWLLLEKVAGVELWQIGELEVWERVAAWLGGFHARFAGRAERLRADNPHLIEHSSAWLGSWSERARAALERGGDPRGAALIAALERYDQVADAVAAMPRTLVHGELYPSNVLVVTAEEPVGVYPVDWEMAATGPGLIDLAALSGGWDPPERERLEVAYAGGLAAAGAEVPGAGELAEGLARCRLQLAVQWLGWSADWRPPPEHAHDWLDEALALSARLGLA